MNYTFDSFHQFSYTSHFLPLPADVIDSLKGLEYVGMRTPAVLKQLLPNGPMRVEVYVQAVQAGSLIDNLIFRLIFRDEDHYNRWIASIRQKTGIELMENKLPVMGPVIMGLVIFGMGYGAARMVGRDGAGNGNIQEISHVTSSIINTGSIVFNTPVADYSTALRESCNALNLATNACRVISPAKRPENVDSSLIIDNDKRIEIGPAAIAAAPTHVNRSVMTLEMILLENEPITIRALDLDSNMKGWAVVVPRFFDKRVPMDVGDGVNISEVVAGRTVNADIELYFTKTDDGDRRYKNAHVRRIR